MPSQFAPTEKSIFYSDNLDTGDLDTDDLNAEYVSDENASGSDEEDKVTSYGISLANQTASARQFVYSLPPSPSMSLLLALSLNGQLTIYYINILFIVISPKSTCNLFMFYATLVV